jgi:hypothetical protein
MMINGRDITKPITATISQSAWQFEKSLVTTKYSTSFSRLSPLNHVKTKTQPLGDTAARHLEVSK